MTDAPRPCSNHLDLVAFQYPLPHLADAFKRQRKTRIVAIGSSSTAGEGGIIPFPHRLELALRKRAYGGMVDVLNRGIIAQEAQDELARFEGDVMAEAPAMVIWQIGTNAVFHKEIYNFDDIAAALASGLDWLAPLPIDVVLMDLQYTTAVVKPEKIEFARQMVSLISAAAAAARVNVFRRFELMRQWNENDGVPMSDLIDPTDPDQLHMSDWATQCLANSLDAAIGRAIGKVHGNSQPAA